MFILGLISNTISTAVASVLSMIDYSNDSNEFEYKVDGSGNNEITNQGTSSTTNDLLLNAGEGLEVGATQVFDIPIDTNGDCVAMYNVTTAAWVYITTTTTPTYETPTGTYGHIVNLSTEPSTADKAILEANIHALADLWFGRATTLTMVKSNIQHFYIPKVEQGGILQDLCAALGSHAITGTTWTVQEDNSPVSVTNITSESATHLHANQTAVSNIWIRPILRVAGTGHNLSTTKYKLSFDLTLISGTFSIYSINNGVETVIGSSTAHASDLSSGHYDFIINGGNDVESNVNISIDGRSLWSMEMDNISFQPIEIIEVPNYAATMYTNADINPKGQQTLPIVFDGSGRATAVDYNSLHSYAIGYADTQWNPSLESAFWLEEVVDGVVYQHKYDGTNLTTYTDNIAGTPTAHSPENADYLIGKGEYPQVAADTEASYEHTLVSVWTGSSYTGYTQATAYTTLNNTWLSIESQLRAEGSLLTDESGNPLTGEL